MNNSIPFGHPTWLTEGVATGQANALRIKFVQNFSDQIFHARGKIPLLVDSIRIGHNSNCDPPTLLLFLIFGSFPQLHAELMARHWLAEAEFFKIGSELFRTQALKQNVQFLLFEVSRHGSHKKSIPHFYSFISSLRHYFSIFRTLSQG